MSPAAFVHTLSTLGAVAALIWFFYGPWNRFVVELARQNLFEIRDEVFDLASAGQISYDNEVYRLVRARLNRMIRFCHHMTLPSAVLASLLTSNLPRIEPDVLEVLRTYPDRDIARSIERSYLQAVLIVSVAMVFRSALMAALVLLLLPWLIISEMLRGSGAQKRAWHAIRGAVERDIDLSNVCS